MELNKKQNLAFIVIRVFLALTMIVHGFARFLAGGINPFGDFLTSVGFPLGNYLAWAITIIEIVGGIALIFGYLVPIIALFFAFQLTLGIILVHAKEGWFVVGLGRNGMEYSVLLIVSFLAIAFVSYDKPKV